MIPKSVLDIKLNREFKANLGVLISIASIMVAGLGCYIALNTTHSNLWISKEKYYSACRMFHFSVDVKKMPRNQAISISHIPGVSSIDTRIVFSVLLDVPDEENIVSGLVISMPDQRVPVINDVILRQGSYFSPSAKNEVIVEERFAKAHKLQPGDHIQMILNQRKENMVIVGTAISCEFTYMSGGKGSFLPDYRRFGVFYLQRKFMEEIFDFQDSCNQVLGIVHESYENKLDPILKEAEKKLENYGVLSTTPRDLHLSHRFLSDEMANLGKMAEVLPTVFLMVAAFVLNILMRRLIDQQRTTVGTLKALGYRDRAIFFHYMQFGLVVALLAFFLGSGFGLLLAKGLTSFYDEYYRFPKMYFFVYPHTLLLGFLISLVFSMSGTVRALWIIRSLKPAEAMRPPSPPQGGSIFLEKWRWFWSRLGFAWKMVLRGIFRNHFRSLVTIFATATSASLLLMGLFFLDAMEYFMFHEYRQTQHYDMDVTFKENQKWPAFLEVLRLPGVDYGEPFLSIPGTLEKGIYTKKISITGLLSKGFLRTPMDVHNLKVPILSEGIVISQKLADILHVKKGENLWFIPTQGRKQRKILVVAQIVEDYVGLNVYTEIGFLSHLMGEEATVSGVMLKINPVKKSLFKRRLKNLVALSGTSEPELDLNTMENLFVKAMRASLLVYVLFAGVISFGSIFNNSLISLSERKKELACLKVLGYTNHEISSIFFRENFLLNMIGFFVGIPLGMWITWGMMQEFSTEFIRFPLVVTWSSCLIAFSLAFLFSLIAHWSVKRRIYGTDWLDVLKVRE